MVVINMVWMRLGPVLTLQGRKIIICRDLEPQDKIRAKWLASMSKTDSFSICSSVNFCELCCCVSKF